MQCHLDRITIEYEVRGTGAPMLMLHGAGCDRNLMIGCMEPMFADRTGWRRIYLDLPGMGCTVGEDWIQSSDDILATLEQFVDKVLPGEQFALAGESYGGYLSRALLSRRPDQVDGMLLICPSAGIAKRDAPPFHVVYKDEGYLESVKDDEAFSEFTRIQVVQDGYNFERFKAEIFSGLQVRDVAFMERIISRNDLTAGEELKEPYENPVLILAGRQDHSTGYRNQWEFAQEYPHASYVMLDRAGHNLQIEQPRLFQALVCEWMERVEEKRFVAK